MNAIPHDAAMTASWSESPTTTVEAGSRLALARQRPASTAFRLSHDTLDIRGETEVLQESPGGAAPLVGHHERAHAGGAQITQALRGSRVHVGDLPVGGVVVPAEGRRQLPTKSRRRRRVRAGDHVIERQAEVRAVDPGVAARHLRKRRPQGCPHPGPSVEERSVEVEERRPPAGQPLGSHLHIVSTRPAASPWSEGMLRASSARSRNGYMSSRAGDTMLPSGIARDLTRGSNPCSGSSTT
jgi:hypothetical protein